MGKTEKHETSPGIILRAVAKKYKYSRVTGP